MWICSDVFDDGSMLCICILDVISKREENDSSKNINILTQGHMRKTKSLKKKELEKKSHNWSNVFKFPEINVLSMNLSR